MPEQNRPPRIDSIQFGDRVTVITFMDPVNIWPDGGSKSETLVIPTGGKEEEINEILDDVLTLMDTYLADRRDPPKTIRGRES